MSSRSVKKKCVEGGSISTKSDSLNVANTTPVKRKTLKKKTKEQTKMDIERRVELRTLYIDPELVYCYYIKCREAKMLRCGVNRCKQVEESNVCVCRTVNIKIQEQCRSRGTSKNVTAFQLR